MIYFPNAKINIGLNIVKKRPDGFHNIETIFYPIRISDVLEITQSDKGTNFTNSGIQVEGGNIESNLCYRAYQLLKRDFSLPDVNIHLHKIIPFGSGLGGGSSDASYTLIGLNQIFKLNLSSHELIMYAKEIGSDCAIFIKNTPSFAIEKGNILNPVEINLKAYTLVLIHPKIHINTGEAYSKSTPQNPKVKLSDLIKQPIENWKNSIFNDFESIIFPVNPEIERIKNILYKLGALYSSMSGSGSSVYGIFKNDVEINDIFPKDYFIWKETL